MESEISVECHFLPCDANGFSCMEEPTLPHMETFHETVRHHTQNPVQLSSDKTTWEQFGINNETRGYAQYISHSLCPFNRDDPLFTIRSIHSSTLNFKQSKWQKTNDCEQNETGATPSQYMLEQTRKPKKRIAERKEIIMKKQTRNRVSLSEPCCSLKLGDSDNMNSIHHLTKSTASSVDVNTNGDDFLESLTQVNTDSNCFHDSSKNIETKECLSSVEKSGEEGTSKLFSTLKDLLKSKNRAKNKILNKSVSRLEILDTTATVIKFLKRKRAKIREKLSWKKASTGPSCKKKKLTKKRTENKRRNSGLSNQNLGQVKTMLHKDRHPNRNESQNVQTNVIEKCKSKSDKIFQTTKSAQTQKSPIAAKSKNTSPGSVVNLVSKSNQKLVLKEICSNRERVKRKAKKEKEKMEKNLHKKAFGLYAKHWRPRLKKEFPDRTSVEINDLLNSRWNTACRKTKRHYEKKWQEQWQLRKPHEKKKVLVENKINRNKSSKSNKKTSTVRNNTEHNGKKKIVKITNDETSGVLGNMKEVQKGNDDLDIVNWVQCNHCKIWRILPGNINVDTLPELWFCKMNTDKMHNKCFIAQELSSKKILQRRREKGKKR